jgi:uncharacterized membrane protein YgcG
MNRYSQTTILKNINEFTATLGVEYYGTTTYPSIPLSDTDIYVITEFGDRLDVLANIYYKDSKLYWVIASANAENMTFDSLSIPIGTQLRIPMDISSIISNFNSVNNGNAVVDNGTTPSNGNGTNGSTGGGGSFSGGGGGGFSGGGGY